MLKRIIAVLISTMMIFSLVACGSGSNEQGASTEVNEEGKVVVNMWRHEGTPKESEYYNQLVEDFNSSQDSIELKVTSLPDATYMEQVNAAILSNDLPDLLDLDGPQMAGFANVGALTPIDSFISDTLKNDLLPSIIDQGTYEDGHIYALGQFESGLSFWANKSLLEEAGVRIPTLDSPWDTAEFYESLDKLKALDSVQYPLDIKLNYGTGYWIYSYLPFVASFGGDYFDSTDFSANGALNSDASIKAFEMVQEMAEKGYINGNQSTDDDFYGSKISALSLVGHWMYPTHTSEEGLGEDAILIPFPDFGKGVKTGSGSWAWSMTSAAKEHNVEDEVWTVLEYLLSESALAGIFEANGAIPSRVSVLDQIPEFQENGILYLYREQLEKGHAKVRPVTPVFGVIQSEVGEAAMNIIKGSDVLEELNKAVEEIDQTVEDNGYHGK